MPQPVDPAKQFSRGLEGTPPLRRRPKPVQEAPSPIRNRILNYALALITIVLVVDALVGDKGLLETIRARRQFASLRTALNATRRENSCLREQIRRLREDPGTVEAIAREELGLIRRGEILFIIRDGDRKR